METGPYYEGVHNILTGDTKKEQNARNNYLLGRQTYGTLTKTFKSYWDT